MKLKILKIFSLLAIGFALGAYLFTDTQPRHFLNLKDCGGSCFQPKEIAGLLTSIGIQKFDLNVIRPVLETDKTIVLRHPHPETPLHLLIFPKKDIKNIGEISESDKEYIMDSLAVIRQLVKDRNLANYQVITNGPGQQQITYLHFHLMAQEPDNIP